MKRRYLSVGAISVTSLGLLLASACSTDDTESSDATGGSTASGGNPFIQGGGSNRGGAANGGSSVGNGGSSTKATGGATAAGGAPASGGKANGGAPQGGSSATGVGGNAGKGGAAAGAGGATAGAGGATAGAGGATAGAGGATAGTAGKAGGAGTPGTGGATAGSAGKGGNAGNPGTGGATAGSAGTVGSAGTAGAAGASNPGDCPTTTTALAVYCSPPDTVALPDTSTSATRSPADDPRIGSLQYHIYQGIAQLYGTVSAAGPFWQGSPYNVGNCNGAGVDATGKTGMRLTVQNNLTTASSVQLTVLDQVGSTAPYQLVTLTATVPVNASSTATVDVPFSSFVASCTMASGSSLNYAKIRQIGFGFAAAGSVDVTLSNISFY